MTLEEFQKLDADERMPIIAGNGKNIGKMVHNGEACRIMSVYNFFVEFIYTDATFSSISAIRSFSNGPQLDKYSPDLSDLLE